MASIIPGYQYDIFISYRQKDNKGDRWVSEFVDALKDELESTFKEEISVYFDINPHDGLLETHDVYASLNEKLKCLIFIPIISQTYCDPKSFAWEHELLAFIEMASKDQFGLRIKLPGGNVTSRILPVKIHDIDANDKVLLEKELGGVLRAIEFIYKSPGVNRPLRSNEEHPDENINRIIYRDQINKTANAIKEILYSMAFPEKAGSYNVNQSMSHAPDVNHSTFPAPDLKPVGTHRNSRFRAFMVIVVFFLVILIFSTKTLISKNKLNNSIIVLPFSTQDTTQKYFAEGIAVDVITELAKINNISTLSWNTSDNYARTSKSLKEIASETGVSYVLTGIIQKDNQNIRVNVVLVNPETGKSLWAQSWDQELKFVFDIQKQIAKDVARELGVKLSYEENAKLERYSTRNFEAYDLFLKASAESRKLELDPMPLRRSNRLLEDALEIDPDFPQALTLKANNLIDLAWKEGLDPLEEAAQAKEYLNKAIALDPYYSDAYIVLGIVNYYLEWDFSEAKKNLEKGWELTNYGEAPISHCLCGIIEYNMAKGDFLEALSFLSKVEKIDPDYPYKAQEKTLIYAILQDTAAIHKILRSYSGPVSIRAIINYNMGKYDEAIKGFLAENKQDPELSALLASAYYKIDMAEKSDSIVNQLKIRSNNERNIDFSLAIIFAAREDKENALKWYKSAYKNHDLGITSTVFRPELKLIINEPEVQKILREIGITDGSADMQ